MNMNPYKLSDFKVGETVYIEYTGNIGRHLKRCEGSIGVCVVESVGRKFVIAEGVKYKEHDSTYGGLIENTEGCVNRVLYPNKQVILDKWEKEAIIETLGSYFTGYVRKPAEELSLEKLRQILEIIHNEILSAVER